jgi:hypothetical protein
MRPVKSQKLSVRCPRPPFSRAIAPLLLTLSRETSGADLVITQTKNADQELVFRDHEGFDIKAVLTLS